MTEVRYDAGESPGIFHGGIGELGANEEIVV